MKTRSFSVRAMIAGLLALCLLLNACSSGQPAASPTAPESTAAASEQGTTAAPAVTTAAAETSVPAETTAAPAETAAVPAESTAPVASTAELPTVPADSPITPGTPLFLALGDEHLAGVEAVPPYSVAVSVSREDGRDTVQTSDSGVVREFCRRFAEITVGARSDAAAAPLSDSLVFFWNGGSSASFVTLNGGRLEVMSGGVSYYYDLENFDSFWEYASNLSEYISDPDDEYQVVNCPEQRFSTLCDPGCLVDWVDGDGLYIALEESKTIPYVLIYRFADAGVTATQYLQNTVIPNMQNRYGDNLLEISEIEEAQVTETQFVSMIRFTYRVGDSILYSYRVAGNYGNDVVSFNAKYDEESEDDALDELELVVAYFHIDGPMEKTAQEPKPVQPSVEPESKQVKGVTVTPTKAASAKLTTYSDAWVTFKVPEGWVVETGYGPLDFFMYYAVTAYDPENPDCRIFFSLKTDGYLIDKASHDWMRGIYPDSPFAILPYLDPVTLENFYNNATEAWTYFYGGSMNIPQIRDFTVIEEMGKSLLDGRIVRASSKNAKGSAVEGVYSASLYTINLAYFMGAMAYHTFFCSAPEGELADWLPLLDECLASFTFTQDFITCYYRSEDLMMGTIKANQALYDEVSDMIMDSWEKRNTTYDIASQKRSDATMGYERVYDTQTGEIYKAKNGFMDHYHGSDFAPVTDDMYLLPTAGYIE